MNLCARIRRCTIKAAFHHNQSAMPPVSEESSQIVASLAQRMDGNPGPSRAADAIIATLQDIDSALTPIIGQHGVAALYRRSLLLCAASHPRLAGSFDNLPARDMTALKTLLLEQSEADSVFFGETLLKTLYELLTTLIGPSLTARLLRAVWENSLSGNPAQDTSP